MDLPTTLVILLVGAAVIGWLGGARDGRALEAFGAGFIGYRSYGWPQGVQEEDSVYFSLAAWHAHPTDDDDETRPLGGPELIELDERTAVWLPLERL